MIIVILLENMKESILAFLPGRNRETNFSGGVFPAVRCFCS
jgi:hypothetical protein